MGFYDAITCQDQRFVCSEGHQLLNLQTKDLGCTGGSGKIEQEVLTLEPNIYDSPIKTPITKTIQLYATCHQCPALVSIYGNMVSCWVEFKVSIIKNHVKTVKRVSADAKIQLEEARYYSNMQGEIIEVSYAEALKLHAERIARRGKM